MSDLRQILEGEGQALLAKARAAAEHGWGAMDPQHKADVQRLATRRLPELLRQHVGGADVRADLARVKATLLNYAWDGGVGVLGPVGRALLDGLIEAAGRVASALAAGLAAEVGEALR